jgi:hypothetical protein
MGHMAAPLNTTNTEAIDTAAEAAVQAFNTEPDAYLDDHDLARMAVRAAVTAELRRLATEARKAAEAWGVRAKQCNPGTPAWESAVVTAEKRWFMVSHLEMRAAELDSGAR